MYEASINLHLMTFSHLQALPLFLLRKMSIQAKKQACLKLNEHL